MTNPIRRVKANSFYREWHFEIGILVLFVGLSLVAVGLVLALDRGSRAGEQAHRALCAQKASSRQALDRNQAYLRMSPDERIRRYGPIFGNVPDSVIHQQILAQRRTLRSYRDLSC